MDKIIYIVLGVLAALILWIVGIYNGLIKLKNRTEEAVSDIDVQLKRRYDLIPNLIETVKGYMSHEEKVLTEVTNARNMAMNAKNPQEKLEAENTLTGTLKTLFAVSENYPNLKASENFMKLQDELSDTENKIQAARRFYNGNARDFNIKIQVFPDNIIANMLKFKKFEFFEAEEKAKENVQVKF
ncbi:MAG: LemA family protein [Patescibacteria group bacterium]|nr:LemA family protein [Patescibacteria group bacterium]MDD4304199.1 LemA family protein [Patescibacteria group bacterium]MDD4695231.1 LemA family protein [Patescibacteria group bacterium]